MNADHQDAAAASALGWRNVSTWREGYGGAWSGVDPVTGRVREVPAGLWLGLWLAQRCRERFQPSDKDVEIDSSERG